MSTPPPIRLLHIASANIVSSLGDDAHTSAAALATHRRGFRHVEVKGIKLNTAPAEDITKSTMGAARIQALMDAVLHPLPQLLSIPPQTHAQAYDSRCVLILPDWLNKADQQHFGDHVLKHLSALVSNVPVHFYADQGPLASHRALHKIMQEGYNSQTPYRIIFICVESLCEPHILKRDHTQGLVGYHHDGPPAGSAGEAAVCLILDSATSLDPIPSKTLAIHLPALTPAGVHPRWPSDVGVVTT